MAESGSRLRAVQGACYRLFHMRMRKLVESFIALAIALAVLPLFLIACGGLILSQVRPIFIRRVVPLGSENAGWVFNSGTSRFGLCLRRYSVDKLPLLLGVLVGSTRLQNSLG